MKAGSILRIIVFAAVIAGFFTGNSWAGDKEKNTSQQGVDGAVLTVGAGKNLSKGPGPGESLTHTRQLTRTQQQRVKAYEQAVQSAQQKVQRFKKAIKSRDPARIRKATLEIQADPAAVKQINKENVFVKNKFVKTTETIHSETIQRIKQRVAKKYGVRPEDVRVKEFTNPGSEIKAGHDWDATVSIKGKGEIPLKEAKPIVEESYFEAAGGKKAYSNSNAREFAETHHLEVTNSRHAEAYEGGKKTLDNPGKAEIKDPERFSKTIEHKSNLEGEKVAGAQQAGDTAGAEVAKGEQARQYTKQYEKIIEPRVKEFGGKVPAKVKAGTKILQKVGKFDPELGRVYTPADADAALAGMGETTESIIQKGSALVESAQKLKPRNGSKVKTAGEKGQVGTSEGAAAGEGTAAGEGKLGKGKKMAGKVLETAGQGAVIFNTAEDVKEALQGKKEWREVGKNAADTATGGAISTTEQTLKKNRDAGETIRKTDYAQSQEDEAHILAMGLKLRKNGVPKEDVGRIMEDMRKGKNKSLIQKLSELRKEGKVIPLSTPEQVELPDADDTAWERTKEVGKGMADYGKRAGKFVVDAGKDVKEIAGGLTEKGVAEELVKQKKESAENLAEAAKSLYHAHQTEKEGLEQEKRLKEMLIAKGATEEQADSAISRFKKGHINSLKNLRRKLQEKNDTEADTKTGRESKEEKKKAAEADKEKTRKESEAAVKRLREKIEKSKREDIPKDETPGKKNWADMTREERHEALKNNDDEAWKKMGEALKSGDPDRIKEATDALGTKPSGDADTADKLRTAEAGGGNGGDTPNQENINLANKTAPNTTGATLQDNDARNNQETQDTRRVASLTQSERATGAQAQGNAEQNRIDTAAQAEEHALSHEADTHQSTESSADVERKQPTVMGAIGEGLIGGAAQGVDQAFNRFGRGVGEKVSQTTGISRPPRISKPGKPAQTSSSTRPAPAPAGGCHCTHKNGRCHMSVSPDSNHDGCCDMCGCPVNGGARKISRKKIKPHKPNKKVKRHRPTHIITLTGLSS